MAEASFFIIAQLPDGDQKDGPYPTRDAAAAAGRQKYPSGVVWWIIEQTQ